MRTSLVLFTTLSMFAGMAPGCDSDESSATRSCETLCSEAQAGDCTEIKGDCGAFCTALDNEEGAAGCAAQRAAYQRCLSPGPDVCENDCAAAENAVINCFTPHCLANGSDPDCQTLVGAFCSLWGLAEATRAVA